MWRMECASGWSNRDGEVVLVVTGFVTDMEEGFKTHGHFATRQKPSLLSMLIGWCRNVRFSGSISLLLFFLVFSLFMFIELWVLHVVLFLVSFCRTWSWSWTQVINFTLTLNEYNYPSCLHCKRHLLYIHTLWGEKQQPRLVYTLQQDHSLIIHYTICENMAREDK